MNLHCLKTRITQKNLTFDSQTLRQEQLNLFIFKGMEDLSLGKEYESWLLHKGRRMQ
jgi:hypothetical protein